MGNILPETCWIKMLSLRGGCLEGTETGRIKQFREAEVKYTPQSGSRKPFPFKSGNAGVKIKTAFSPLRRLLVAEERESERRAGIP